ncbi:uncharacterized protein LOC113330201 isoform X2 [Papaver somniferum]|uniref:uncharacterized protein LOC113330201 isoform X2 n=1 Tax=Papaver somniferum TaxID=3469 RepID=UPI000E6F5DA8|nr:uncharacterized protein LOC113330201 isoform X2 [Papaver somniferum]
MAKSESTDHQRSERKLPPSPKVAPWLVYPYGKLFKFQTFCDIFDLDSNKSFKKFIPELSIKKYWQKNSHQGWVIVLNFDDEDPNFNYKEFFLWNPASLETIVLPSLPDLVEDYSIIDCVLSSPPQNSIISSSSNSSSSLSHCGSSSSFSCSDDEDNVDYDSMVYILYDGDESPDVLIYCHPGEKQWRIHVFVDVGQSLESMFYFKGKLYVMCLNNVHIEIEIQYGSDTEDAEILSVSDAISVGYNSGIDVVAGGLDNRCHFDHVESFGEVFQIFRNYFPRGIYENCVTGIYVWKLDFSSMTWEEMKSMDDRIFFLGGHTQLSCLASDLGLAKGCVYFTQAKEMSLYKYDLEDDSILLSFPCPNLPAPWYPPKWLMISATPRFDVRTGATDHVSEQNESIHKVIGATENQTADKEGKKGDVKEAGPRIMLKDDHMVWLISNYLYTLDYIHFRAVSKNFWRMLNLRRSSSTRTVQTTDLSPWLVFPKHQAVYNFINPMHNNENYLMNIPESLKGARIQFSKGGWLLLSKGETLFFYNPFTRSTVKLPDLPDSYHHFAFTGISFSSLPTSPDCIVFGIGDRCDDRVEILFIKRGDESWIHNIFDNIYLPSRTNNVNFQLNYNNPVSHSGAFYCLDLNGTLGVFKLGHGISWGILAMVAPPNSEFIYKSFLVECDGKLMSVLLGHLGKWVRIFRLNDTEMVWVEVKCLGRYMLCISNTACVSAMAPTSRMENKIYFPRLHNEGILYYSLDTVQGNSEESLSC